MDKAEFKKNISLYTALGLIRGSIHIETFKDFDKAGLIRNLKEVQQILEEFLNDE
jgi:hypothetical protein